MNLAHDRLSSYRRTDVLVGFIALAAIACMLAPAVAQLEENSDRAQCLNNAKQIVLGTLKLEYSRDSFPMASTQPITAKPGHFGDADASGFSWLVMVLPNLEDIEATRQFDKLMVSSDRFAKPPFDPSVTAVGAVPPVAPRDFAVRSFLCPSFVANFNSDNTVAEARGQNAANKLPPLSNYHAMAGSHFYNKAGLGRMEPAAPAKSPDGQIIRNLAYEGSGAIAFPRVGVARGSINGVRIRDVADGIAHTVAFAESRERQFATWLDGQVTWLVAAWPGNSDLPGWIQVGRPPRPPVIGWDADELHRNWTSLNKQWSPKDERPTPAYLTANRWSGPSDRVWGPSSFHGGFVTHAFCDGRVHLISELIDKNVYLHLATRDGREVDAAEDIFKDKPR
jgi:hypothetical protein